MIVGSGPRPVWLDFRTGCPYHFSQLSISLDCPLEMNLLTGKSSEKDLLLEMNEDKITHIPNSGINFLISVTRLVFLIELDER